MMTNILTENTSLNTSDCGNFMDKRSPLKKVTYMCNEGFILACDDLPKVKGRAVMLNELLAAYGFLEKLICVNPSKASLDDLALFHSHEYLQCLLRLSAEEDDEKGLDEAETFGLTYDCPAYPGVFEHSRMIAGASMKAAQSLLMGIADVAINWYGGWHHAKRDEASGFCYINDAVLAILKLRKKFDRVLYVDIDLHHGDGVEDAFCATSKVMTVSFHKAAPGFFPGTGYLKDTGIGKGRNYSVNVPLKDGITDENYVKIFKRVMDEIHAAFQPQAVVCQCGADALNGDPMATFNLTLRGYGDSLQHVLGWKLPTLLLGGGGYNFPNTARCWSYLTGIALGMPLEGDIPEHRFFTKYGPDYELHIDAGSRADLNDDDYLNQVYQAVKANLEKIKMT